MANLKIVNVEGIVPLYVRIWRFKRTCLVGDSKIPAIDLLLGTSFINRCIRGILPAEKSRALALDASGDY